MKKKLWLPVILTLTALTGHSQTALEFQYSAQFKPATLDAGKLHYSNPPNDPQYKPTLEVEGNQTVLKLQSLSAQPNLYPKDTQLSVIRIIDLPQTAKTFTLQVETRKLSPAIASLETQKKTSISVFFIDGIRKHPKITLIVPNPSWTTFSKKIKIPENSKKAVIELKALDGEKLEAKNWKIKIE